MPPLIPDKPRTFVLVHGAWHGGWCWKRVRDILEAAGHRVYTPTQTGLGERSHLLGPGITLDTFVRDVFNVLVWEDLHEVILVGHSFGGASITGVADRERNRIAHLVYLDALVPQSGQSPFSVIGEDVAARRREQAVEASGGVWMLPPDPERLAWSTQRMRRGCVRAARHIRSRRTKIALCSRRQSARACRSRISR